MTKELAPSYRDIRPTEMAESVECWIGQGGRGEELGPAGNGESKERRESCYRVSTAPPAPGSAGEAAAGQDLPEELCVSRAGI